MKQVFFFFNKKIHTNTITLYKALAQINHNHVFSIILLFTK